MNKKTILSTIVLSMVAVSMVACDSKINSKTAKNSVSARGPIAPVNLVKVASPLEEAKANLKALEAQQVVLNKEYGEVSTDLFEAEKEYNEASIKVEYFLAGHQESDNVAEEEKRFASMFKQYKAKKETAIDLREEVNQARHAINTNVSLTNVASKKVQLIEVGQDLEYTLNTIDYKNGDPKSITRAESKEKKLVELKTAIADFEGENI